jgi:hypothetical protein
MALGDVREIPAFLNDSGSSTLGIQVLILGQGGQLHASVFRPSKPVSHA